MVRTFCLSAVGVGALVFALYLSNPHPFIRVYEDANLFVRPSAERAVAYGDRYFNALSNEYDIARAERMYLKAMTIDPDARGVQHQIARIEFLRNNLPKALAHINREIELYGVENPNSYYIRALILGYMGRYMDAAADYETYFTLAPANWAGINDYAWVLLKADLPEAALAAVEWGLTEFPDNPWLLHNKVIALYELGRYEAALEVAIQAEEAVARITEVDWLTAYPGNDPKSATQGLASFQKAVRDNRVKVQAAFERE